MPALDSYEYFTKSILAPLDEAFSVTPSDTADLPYVTRSLMVTAAGDVSVVMKSGDTVTLPGLEPGTIYPIRVARVRATGTTATGIVGLY